MSHKGRRDDFDIFGDLLGGGMGGLGKMSQNDYFIGEGSDNTVRFLGQIPTGKLYLAATKRLNYAFDKYLKGKNIQEVETNKREFFQFLFHDYAEIQHYTPDDPSRIIKYEKGLEDRCEELAKVYKTKGFSTNAIADKKFPADYDGFLSVNKQGANLNTKDVESSLMNIVRYADKLKGQFDTDLKNAVKDSIGDGKVYSNCKVDPSHSPDLWMNLAFHRVVSKYLEDDIKALRFAELTLRGGVGAMVKLQGGNLKKSLKSKKFQIKDLLRATVEVSSLEKTIGVFNALAKKFPVLQVKNKLDTDKSDAAPYPVVYVVMEYKGLPFEVQIIPSLQSQEFALKKTISHILYDLSRSENIFAFLLVKRQVWGEKLY